MTNLRRMPLTRQEVALIEAIASAAERGVTLTRQEAGILAGYGTGESGRVMASRALARPAVRAALLERASQTISADTLHAVHIIRHVRSSEGPQQLTAAIETLKLAGMGQAQGPAGPAVVLHLHLPEGVGAGLAQYVQRAPPVIDAAPEPADQPEMGDDHPLLARRQRGPDRPKPARGGVGASPKGAKSGGRGQKRGPRVMLRGPRTISPETGGVTPEEGS